MDVKNILLSKQDLENYPSSDLLVLAKHRGVTSENQQDLLWLLSLDILGEDKTVRGTMPSDAERERLMQWARENGVIAQIQQVLDGEVVLDLSSQDLGIIPPEIRTLSHL